MTVFDTQINDCYLDVNGDISSLGASSKAKGEHLLNQVFKLL
jgi:hypothetical protein